MRRNAALGRVLRVAIRPVILGLFLLPALLPMLQVDTLPCTHDNIFHGYRLVAMRGMLEHGWIFSRWVPNLALGYGYPFFNYREPLPYVAGTLIFAAGVPLPLVLGLIYVTGLIGAAWGAFELARALFGPRAAWIAGIAYGLGPYLLMDPLRRGNMPESVALALIPWLFVTLRRIVVARRGRSLWAAVTLVLLVSLFLSHNISSLMLAPFLGLYVVILAFIYRDRGGWQIAFLMVGLAVLLTAWFWLPALVEQEMVQLHLSRTTRNNDFRYNFVTWREMLFTLPVPHDPAYLNPPMRIALGVGQWVLALVGAVVGLRRRGGLERRWMTVLFVVASLAYLGMATPGAVGIWERFPLLAFVQFPWRLVGRALLPVSLLAGQAATLWFGASGVEAGARGRGLPTWISATISGALVLLLVVSAWPETYPPKGICAADSYPNLKDLYARELEGWMGMDPESSYFPIWVEDHPTDTRLAEAFAEGRLPERLDTRSLPVGTELLRGQYRPLSAALAIRAPVEFRARWLGLYFPGWEVQVDGAPVEVTPEQGTGLLTFVVPKGEHVVTVRFGMTPSRRLGTIVSAIGGVVALMLSLRWLVRRLAAGHESRAGVVGPADGVPGDLADTAALAGAAEIADVIPTVSSVVARGLPTAAILGLAVVMLGVRLWAVDRVSSPVAQSRLEASPPPDVARRVEVPFSGGLTLVGVTFEGRALPADAELSVDLLWKAREVPTADYHTVVLLRGADGRTWSPAGTERPRGYERPTPSSGWRPGAYAFDPHLVSALPGTPPGRYEVVVAAFDADSLVPASVLDSEGRPLGPDLVLGTVTLTPPVHPLDLARLGVEQVGAPAHCGSLTLLAMTADRVAAAPGDVVAMRWIWEVSARPADDLVATLTLLDGEGATARVWSLPPVAAWWPSGVWSAGDRWVGRHVVRLPGGLASGAATLNLALPGCDAPLAAVSLEVVAPARAWTVPEELTPVAVRFGEIVELAGAALPSGEVARGETVEVVLAWRTLAEMEDSYHVFLHLVNERGQIIAQSDGEPAAWGRPTTGWATDEVVTETRTLTVPKAAPVGEVRLLVGLYVPGEGRLRSSEGEDGYLLATLAIR